MICDYIFNELFGNKPTEDVVYIICDVPDLACERSDNYYYCANTARFMQVRLHSHLTINTNILILNIILQFACFHYYAAIVSHLVVIYVSFRCQIDSH